MTYELAKQLKDAGFKFRIVSTAEYWEGEDGVRFDGDDEVYFYPTLSEIIEACGDGFDALHRDASIKDPTKVWWSCVVKKGMDTVGNTPEEAVANLWLALNKKPGYNAEAHSAMYP